MDENLKQLWSFCIWYAGISTTVTLGFFGWMMNLSSRMTIRQNIHGDLSEIKASLEEIKTSLIGNYREKGLITKHHELEQRVEDLIKKS